MRSVSAGLHSLIVLEYVRKKISYDEMSERLVGNMR